jgi:hypothetical protein
MPIDPVAIDRFLQYTKPSPFDPRGMEPAKLIELIEQTMGVEYKPKTTLRYWQLESLAFICARPGSMLLLDMRLGKTLVSLQWIELLKKSMRISRKVLIIVPRPVVTDVWVTEAEKHTTLKVTKVLTDAGMLIDALQDDADAMVVSWFTLQSLFTTKRVNRKGKNQLAVDADLLSIFASFFDCMIIDESHECAKHTSLRFAFATHAGAGCHHRLMLTGTPYGRDPFRIWAQAFLADRGATFSSNFYFFQAAFGREKKNYARGGALEIVFDNGKLPEFTRKLHSNSFSYAFKEVKNMEIVQGRVELQMTIEQKKHYKNAISSFIQTGQGDTFDMDAIFIRLRQISSGFLPFKDDEGTERMIVFDSNPKIDWLDQFIDYMDQSLPVIVFYEFNISGDLICNLLAKKKIPFAALRGNTKDKSAPVADFQRGKAKWLVVNSKSGNAAIDLAIADYTIFYESPVSPTIRSQAEKRAQGERQGRPLFIDDMIISPIEERVLGFVTQGKNMVAATVHNRKALLLKLGNV